MAVPCRFRLARLPQLLDAELADRLQHPEADRIRRDGRPLDEALCTSDPSSSRKSCLAPSVGSPRPRRPPASSRRRTPRAAGTATAPCRRGDRGSTRSFPGGCAGGPARRRGRQEQPRRRSSLSRMASGVSSLTREAASSIANGRPSSRRHSSTTAEAFASVSLNPGSTAVARWTNRATDPYRIRFWGPTGGDRSGRSAGGTVSCCSPVMCSGSLVARIRIRGATASSSAATEAPSITCSKLSRRRSISRSRTWSLSVSRTGRPSARAPTASAMVEGTRCGSVMGASSTRKTPSDNHPAAPPPLGGPVGLAGPPGPVRVRSPGPRRSSLIRARSRSRPMKPLRWTGRFVGVSRVRMEGNSPGSPSMASWKIRSGRARSLRRWSPRSRSRTPWGSPSLCTSSEVAIDSNTWPPWPEAAIRAARWTSIPT